MFFSMKNIKRIPQPEPPNGVYPFILRWGLKDLTELGTPPRESSDLYARISTPCNRGGGLAGTASGGAQIFLKLGL